MQPFKQLSHLVDMRKLFFILLLLGWGSSFAQEKLISPYIGLRPVRGELRVGVLFNINKEISIGPEVGYQIYSLAKDNLYLIDDSYSTYYSKIDPFLNAFIMDKSIWFGIKYRQLVKSNNRIYTMSLASYYQYGSAKNINYFHQKSNDTGQGLDISIYEGGDLQIRNYGIEGSIGFMLLNYNNFGVEIFTGASLFYKKNSITYDLYKLDAYYMGDSKYEEYEEPQKVFIKRLDIKLQTGLNLVF